MGSMELCINIDSINVASLSIQGCVTYYGSSLAVTKHGSLLNPQFLLLFFLIKILIMTPGTVK